MNQSVKARGTCFSLFLLWHGARYHCSPGAEWTIKYPEVKVIVSSGFSTDPIMTDCKIFGFCGGVPKPCTLGELGRSVHAVLPNQITSD
jgi:hypothetical protein